MNINSLHKKKKNRKKYLKIILKNIFAKDKIKLY
jgi:hypothetical protein